MATITILPFNTVIPCADDESILHAVLASRHALASSCGGEGVCDKCRVLVLAGMEHLSRPRGAELRAMSERPFLPNERMACQATISGDVCITTTYW